MVKFYQSYRAVIEGTNDELIGGKIVAGDDDSSRYMC